jgi:hypothetical protein
MTIEKDTVVRGFIPTVEHTGVVTRKHGEAITPPVTEEKKEPAKEEVKAETKASGGADALRAQMAAQMAGYHFHKGEHMAAEYRKKPVNFVTAKNGIFRVTANAIGVFASRLGSAPTTAIPGLTDLKEGVTLLVPKIPFKYWLKILSFYRDVHKQDTTEASVLYFWNHDAIEIPRNFEGANGQPGRAIHGIYEDGPLVVYCPEQENSAGLSEFHMDGMVNWLRQFCTPLCETHSHHTMGAFWSSTDNANENMTQFYGVYGLILQKQPAFLFRYVHGADKKDISIWELFEKPITRVSAQIELDGLVIDVPHAADTFEYNGPWPNIDYPDDWMGQHKKRYTTPANNQYPGREGNWGSAAAGNWGGSPRRGDYPTQEDWREWDHRTNPRTGGVPGDNEDIDAEIWYQSRTRHTASAQVETLDDRRAKKNQADGDPNLNPVTRLNLETKGSLIEIESDEALSTHSQENLEGFLKDITDSGYDHFIASILRKLSIIAR